MSIAKWEKRPTSPTEFYWATKIGSCPLYVTKRNSYMWDFRFFWTGEVFTGASWSRERRLEIALRIAAGQVDEKDLKWLLPESCEESP